MLVASRRCCRLQLRLPLRSSYASAGTAAGKLADLPRLRNIGISGEASSSASVLQCD